MTSTFFRWINFGKYCGISCLWYRLNKLKTGDKEGIWSMTAVDLLFMCGGSPLYVGLPPNLTRLLSEARCTRWPPLPSRLSRFHTMPLASPNKALSVQLSGLFSPAPKNTKSLSYLWSVQFSADQKNEVEPWDFLISNRQIHHYQQGSWIGFHGGTLLMKSKMLNNTKVVANIIMERDRKKRAKENEGQKC